MPFLRRIVSVQIEPQLGLPPYAMIGSALVMLAFVAGVTVAALTVSGGFGITPGIWTSAAWVLAGLSLGVGSVLLIVLQYQRMEVAMLLREHHELSKRTDDLLTKLDEIEQRHPNG